MSGNTITRADLLQAVYTSCPSLSRSEAKDIVELAIEELRQALERGESVKLRGFGSFTVRNKRPRVGRNPKTGDEFPITARRVLSFKASPQLIGAINDGAAKPVKDKPATKAASPAKA